MNLQSDYGYPTGAVSMQCVACGSVHENCCDGQPKPWSPFTEFWCALNRALHDLGVVEASYGEARTAYEYPHYTGVESAARGVRADRF